MTPPLPSLQILRDACTDLAGDAAREIMRIYAGDLGERTKADESPVTDADHAAEAIILAGLQGLTPDTPVVAEEEMARLRCAGYTDGQVGEIASDVALNLLTNDFPAAADVAA